MYQEYKNSTLSSETASFFVYLILILIIGTGSVLIQLKRRGENLEDYSYRQYDFKYRRADLKNI